MPRKAGKVPAYCRHKASGQAVVRIDGVDHYLGPYGSAESHAVYERRIAEWRVQQQEHRSTAPVDGLGGRKDLTVEQVLALYWQFAKTYYVRDGRQTNEVSGMKYAIKPVRHLYGKTPVREFGPLALKAVRQYMIDTDLCRNQVNARVNRIKRIFKWAVSEELVPSSVFEALRTVAGLRFGRTNARESQPVRPVPDAWVEAVLPFVSRHAAAMIRLQRLTGMRPNEVVQLRMADIDTSADVWVYEPADHKNRWRGHRRQVPLGPKAQEIIGQFTKPDPEAFLFCPIDAEAERNVVRRANRQTPMTPSQAKRRPKRRPKRAKQLRYSVDSYRRSIEYGIKRAVAGGRELQHWHPNQLRHSKATEVRKLHGIEAAQVSLGHARADVTEVYAEKNLGLAIQIARLTG